MGRRWSECFIWVSLCVWVRTDPNLCVCAADVKNVTHMLSVSVQVEEELWEEEFIERCFQEMLEEEEQWEWFIPSRDLPSQTVSQLQEQISLLVLDADVHADADLEVVVSSVCSDETRDRNRDGSEAEQFTSSHHLLLLSSR